MPRGVYKRVDATVRFWSKVQKTDGCWLWTASCFHFGHGKFSVGGRSVRASRFAWELANGPIPDGLCVLHKCDNPRCVNAARCLFLGTKGDNNKDRSAKGRNAAMFGDANPNTRLRDIELDGIRAAYAAGGVTQRALATHYGCGQSTISRIVGRNKHSRHRRPAE